MTESTLDEKEKKAIAITKARLEALLIESRKEEESLKRYLQMRRLKRRLEASKSRRPSSGGHV